MMMRTTRRLLAAAALALPFVGTAQAQTWPERPITMVIPFAPGGPTDVVGRMIAESMGRDLGQNVLVQNVGGAGGTTGTARVAAAAPDGYNILLHNIGIATAPTLYRRLPYDPVTAFETIGLVTATPMIWLARPGLPVTNFAEMIRLVRERGEAVNLANAGLGSASQLCGTLFQASLGVRVTAVSYTGSGPIYPELMADRLDIYCDQTTSASSFVTSGRVRGLAVTTAEPMAQLPGIPTAGQAGLPGFEIGIWHGVYAPKGTPTPIVMRLNQALRVALADPRVVTRMNELGSPPEPVERQNPDVHRAHLVAEIARWRPVLQAAGQFAD
ncbi:tripartite tricarboxylate transporter substrate-binding protein [Falsiroseomonas sp.]|jgi:tripartite-type tricarboxylate transporter receptor subunit TctC|uniref:tripartite tricarboxylate transporter substrate-binding protein n=1 Tax=Falsiroseomonas sp. TaxID=2870721 RepID=UPI003F713696